MPDPNARESLFGRRDTLAWRIRRAWRLRLRPLWREVRAPVIFAADIPGKLAAVGRIVVPMPLVEPDSVDGVSDAAEIERLAELEHERWVRDKQRSGFAYGPERDDAARVHPSLVPYADLPDSEKDKDRNAVRDLPRMLAEAGFAIERA